MIATRFLWALMLVSGLAMATSIDGTITYQAQIKQNGTPANGTFDFQFKLFDSATVGVGVQHGATAFVNDITLSNGQLAANLNFDNPATPFDGTELFLEVGIRPGNSQPNDPYTLLNPRQRLTEVPYATHTVLSELALTVPNGSITSVQLAANSVGSSNIIDGSVGTADLAAGAVTAAKIDLTTVQKRVTPGCAAGTAVQTVNQDGTVACVAVSGSGGGGTVTSVGTGAGLTGGPITTSGVIGIANGGITSAMIADGTITGADIAAATITGTDIAAGTITNTNINTSLVQQRVVGTCTGAAFVQTIGADGSVTCATAGSGGTGWGLTGNSGTNPGSNFVGTTDNQALQIRSNNARVASFQFATNATLGTGPNVMLGSNINSIVSGVLSGTVGGGGFIDTAGTQYPNTVKDNWGTVGGGYRNTAGNTNAPADGAETVGGGHDNSATAAAAVVAGGAQNTASGIFSAVLGGSSNSAHEPYSTVLGGKRNAITATTGCCSVVGGDQAQLSHTGSFYFVDGSTDTSLTNDSFSGAANNMFAVRATGGVFFFSNTGQTTGVTLAPNSGSWSSASDRNLKDNINPVDPNAVLDRVLALPVAKWNYIAQGDGIVHMGPMAQDFYASFGLGEDDRHISVVDAQGVALAAIQGLNAKLERENAELRAKNDELEARLARIEQTLLGTNGQARR